MTACELPHVRAAGVREIGAIRGSPQTPPGALPCPCGQRTQDVITRVRPDCRTCAPIDSQSGYSRIVSVETALGLVETLAYEQLDRVGGPSHDAVSILMRIEGRQDVVGHVTRISPTRPSYADAEPKEVLAAECLGDGA